MSDLTIMTHDQAVVALSDPTTPPETLSRIATLFYDLHGSVSRHPQAYEALREWMAAIAASAAPPVAAPATAAAEPASFYPASFYPASLYPASGPVAEPAITRQVPATTYSMTAVSPPQSRRLGRRAGIIAGLTVMTLALVGVGAVAAYQKFLGPDGGIADSAKALPASTFAMVEVSIEPSTQQKLALSKMWGKLDGITALLKDSGNSNDFTDDPGTELRPYFWKSIVDGLGVDTSLDYEKDIAPWLGGRVAVGMVGSAASADEALIVAIECKDSKRGLKAINQFIEDGAGDSTEELQVQARNGYIVIASATLDLDAAYASGVLAGQPSFTSVVNGLGSRGLASVWLGTHGAVEAVSSWMDDPSMQAESVKVLDAIDGNAAEAAVFRALDNGLEVQAVSTGGVASDAFDGKTDAGNQLGALPDTTAVAMSVQQVGGLIDSSLSQQNTWSILSQGTATSLTDPFGIGLGNYDNYDAYNQDVQQGIDEARSTLEDTLGLSIPDGMDEVFGGGIVLAIDGDLHCSLIPSEGSRDCTDPSVAVLVAADDANSVIDSVGGWADGQVADTLDSAGIEATVSEDGHLVSWGTGSYAKGLVDSQKRPLSSLPAFAAAMPDGDEATSAVFLSEPGIVNMLKDIGVEPDSDVENALGDIAAIGTTSHVGADGTSTFRLRIIVSN